MDANRFDSVSKLFASRKLSRRQALAQGGVGLAAAGIATAGLSTFGRSNASAQEATPIPSDAEHGPTTLFLQSFESGAIAPKDGEAGTFVLTLEHGLGQTIHFSDRPDRIVGATPTPQFLQALGFGNDNPPNAALLLDAGAGEIDIAVVELFSPTYDETTNTATYDIKVLGDWEKSLDVSLTAEPTDLSTLAASFGSAHLFIDDCRGGVINCITDINAPSTSMVGTIGNDAHDGFCYNWGAAGCYPCTPWFSGSSGDEAAYDYWTGQCNSLFSACDGACGPENVCTSGISSRCESTF